MHRRHARARRRSTFPPTPLLYYSLAVLAKDDLPVKAWADLDKPGRAHRRARRPSSMDKFVTEHRRSKASIQRFPGNAEAIAAFQSGRVDAVCLFHPPLLAARQRLGTGKIVVPTPAQSPAVQRGAAQGDDEAFVAWVDQADWSSTTRAARRRSLVRGVPGRLRPRSQARAAGDEGDAQVGCRPLRPVCTPGTSRRSWANADLLLLEGLVEHAAGHGHGAGLRHSARAGAGAVCGCRRGDTLRWPAGFVIEVFRTTPPLVQLFWFFFALPILIGRSR
jgi:hypothetical protein